MQHGWPEIVATEWSQNYRFKPGEDRGPLDDDIEEIQASIGACAPSITRGQVVADVHFRCMLLVLGVRFPGAPEDWSTGLDVRNN